MDEFDLIDFQKAYNESDIIVFLVNHSKFKNIKLNKENKKVLDFCGIFN